MELKYYIFKILGRHVRLGTASMLPSGEGPFINLARLNVAKYASQQNIAKALFEYIYYHENDVRHVSTLPFLYNGKFLNTVIVLSVISLKLNYTFLIFSRMKGCKQGN